MKLTKKYWTLQIISIIVLLISYNWKFLTSIPFEFWAASLMIGGAVLGGVITIGGTIMLLIYAWQAVKNKDYPALVLVALISGGVGVIPVMIMWYVFENMKADRLQHGIQR